MTKRILFKIFVEEKNVGRAINIMTLAGITGFFLHKYRGLSPEHFKHLNVKDLEDVEKVYEVIKNSQRAVVIGTVVKEERAKKIEELLKEKLKNERWTVMKIPILKVKVNRVQ
ncbi:MAG: hypothetical protein GXN95_03205 [Methanococci archaeon]|nr:hypothetical protein [Methanococci archaeon]